MLLLQNVSKTYKTGVKALHDVNLKIDQGEFVYIIGATGSGKSSLIMLIDGEEIPTTGTVEVAGIDVGKLKHRKVPMYRRNIGVVFQDYRLLPSKTVFENVAFALEVINLPRLEIRRRVRQVLELVGLEDKVNALHCSQLPALMPTNKQTMAGRLLTLRRKKDTRNACVPY